MLVSSVVDRRIAGIDHPSLGWQWHISGRPCYSLRDTEHTNGCSLACSLLRRYRMLTSLLMRPECCTGSG